MPLAVFPKCFLDALCVQRSMSPEQWIDLASGLDVDGLEFYWNFTPADDAARLKRLRARAAAHGLCIPMMCYSPDFIRPRASDRAAELARARTAIEVSAALGAATMRVLSGQRRPDVSRADGIRMAADCIRALLGDAAAHGVRLVLENHYKDGYWQYPEFAQNRDVFLELVDAIGESPWFGINYDPSNAIVAGDDPLELLHAVAPRVASMHASDRYFSGGTIDDLRRSEADPQLGYAPMLQHGVVGQGMNDYDAIFTILRAAGFQGWISIEDGQDPDAGMENLRLSAEFLRAKMKAHGLS